MRRINLAARGQKSARVFTSVYGQPDNIGDSVLRRAMLDSLRPAGKLHVYAGIDSDFISGLALHPDDVLYGDKQRWIQALCINALTHKCLYAFNTGEVRVVKQFGLSRLLAIPFGMMLRVHGGSVVQLGAGIRDYVEPWRTMGRVSLRSASIVTWRDKKSQKMLNVGSVYPDWAFIEGAPASVLRQTKQRPYLALSLRYDQPYPSAEWINGIREYCHTMNLQPVVVTQVRRDTDRSASLAEDLGALNVAWNKDLHADQEDVLRHIYQQTALIISDRLHALIMGLTEGAVPVDCSVPGNDKVSRTFDGAGFQNIPLIRRDDSSSCTMETLGSAFSSRALLLEKLDSARTKINHLRGLIIAV